MIKVKLTELEQRCWESCQRSNDSNGGDFGCVEDVVKEIW